MEMVEETVVQGESDALAAHCSLPGTEGLPAAWSSFAPKGVTPSGGPAVVACDSQETAEPLWPLPPSFPGQDYFPTSDFAQSAVGVNINGQINRQEYAAPCNMYWQPPARLRGNGGDHDSTTDMPDDATWDANRNIALSWLWQQNYAGMAAPSGQLWGDTAGAPQWPAWGNQQAPWHFWPVGAGEDAVHAQFATAAVAAWAAVTACGGFAATGKATFIPGGKAGLDAGGEREKMEMAMSDRSKGKVEQQTRSDAAMPNGGDVATVKDIASAVQNFLDGCDSSCCGSEQAMDDDIANVGVFTEPQGKAQQETRTVDVCKSLRCFIVEQPTKDAMRTPSKLAAVPAKEVANSPSTERGSGTSTAVSAVASAAGVSRFCTPLAPSPEGMQDFLNVLRRRQLPAQISDECLPRVREILLHCILDCYRDRVKPVQSTVQRRLRESRDGEVVAMALLPLCAREPDRYRIVPPMNGEQPTVLLTNEPCWFNGWLDFEGTDLSFEVWEGLRQFLSNDAQCVPVQPHEAALELRKQNLPFLRNYSLEEIEYMVRLGLARRYLMVDGGNSLRLAGLTMNPGENSANAATSRARAEVEVTVRAATGCEASAEVIAKKDGDSLTCVGDMVEDQDDLAVGLLKLMQRFPDGVSLSILKKLHVETRCMHNLSEEAFRCTKLAKVFNLLQEM